MIWLVAGAEPAAAQRWTVIVRETAGIRRFGYPVSTVLPLTGPRNKVDQLRLLENGKPIMAQFSSETENGTDIRAVSLDFNISLAPYETRAYVVEYGPKAATGRQPGKGGMRVETGDEEFRVLHGSGLEFIVPRNLLGLLRQVRTPKTDYLRSGSNGLLIRYKDHIHFRAGGIGPDGVPTVARVVKAGPLVSTLRFESTEALRGGRSVPSVVTMDFPQSKSWVQVAWTIDDPDGYVAGLGADVNLNVQGEPTLVDFGAGSYVYAPLRKGQAAMLRSDPLAKGASPEVPAWQTLTGPVDALTPYVVAPRGPQLSKAEGWAHVMDRQRCTAVAVADFADARSEADLTVHADGRLQVWRHFARDGSAPPAGPKKLTFWLHFVGMPVHVGAATSPQAMLAPLQAEVRPRAK
jgi:hypothetical protein